MNDNLSENWVPAKQSSTVSTKVADDNWVRVDTDHQGNTAFDSFAKQPAATATPTDTATDPSNKDKTDQQLKDSGQDDYAAMRNADLSKAKGKDVIDPVTASKDHPGSNKGQPSGSYEYPDDGLLNGTVHSLEGAAWNMIAKPLSGKLGMPTITSEDAKNMDEYLGSIEKHHPIASTLAGTAPYIATAPFFPEGLIGVTANFAAVSGISALGKARTEDALKPIGQKVLDVAKEAGEGAAFGPIWHYTAGLGWVGRALTRGAGVTTLSAIYGDNLAESFRQGGVITALSLIFENPMLAKTALGRGTIERANTFAYESMFGGEAATKIAQTSKPTKISPDGSPESIKSGILDVVSKMAKKVFPGPKIAAATVQIKDKKIEDLSGAHASVKADLIQDGHEVGNINTVMDDYRKSNKPFSAFYKWLQDATPDPEANLKSSNFSNNLKAIYDSGQTIGQTGSQIHGTSHDDALDKIGVKKGADWETSRDIDNIIDWERDQQDGGKVVSGGKQNGPERVVTSTPSGHSQEMQAAAKDLGSYDKVYDALKKHQAGEKLTPKQKKHTDAIIAGYRKNLRAQIDPIMFAPDIIAARERSNEIPHTNLINTPERQAMRKKIADQYYGTGAKNKNRRVDLVLGVPAAGKGKFLEAISEKYGSLDIDNDFIKGGQKKKGIKPLPEYENGVGAFATHKESEIIEGMIMAKALAKGDNLAIAWLGKNPDKIDAYIEKFKKLKYEVHVTNVDLPVDKAMSRAVERFRDPSTRRFVDPAYINEIGLTTQKNNDMLKSDRRLTSYEKYSTDVERGAAPRKVYSTLDKTTSSDGGLFGGQQDSVPGSSNSADGKQGPEHTPSGQLRHELQPPIPANLFQESGELFEDPASLWQEGNQYDAGFTTLHPDGHSDFITREESKEAPYNLQHGHSEDVHGLNESKFSDPAPEPKIVNPETLKNRSGEEGKVDIGMLPLVPETAEILSRSHQELKEKFAPYTIGKEGEFTDAALRENLGILARKNDRAEAALSKAKKMFDKLKKDDSLDFINKMETGERQVTPELQKIADVLRDISDSNRDEVIGLGTGKLEHWIENYFPHVWEDPNKVGKMIGRIMGRRPFEGPKYFLKKRTIPTTQEGIDLGFTPVSYNPVDSVLLKTREMQRYIMAHKSINALKDQGLIKFVRVGAKVPDGFVKIDDRFADVTYKNDAGELVIGGKYYAQENAGRILNNYLSPGLRGRSYIYDMYRGAGNTLNQFQLGISAFHLGFTSMDATISKFALGINKLSSGDFAGAIKEFGKAPFAPITNIMQGRDLLQAWYGKDKGELTNKIADLMASGGGRAKMDKFYATHAKDEMIKSIQEGKIATAALKVPFYIVEQVARPIMEYIVPRQKMGVFMDMMKMEMERNPGMGHEQMIGLAQKAWDSVDNRMGQLVYDNLFWHRTTKDLAMASVRSLGWNLGTIRELGGGLKDVTGNVDDLIHGRGSRMSYRTAYVMALPIVTGLYGAIYQYLHTGKGPQELKDYFFPKNGAIDNKGQEARVSLPTYMKDIYHYTTNPVQTVINKFSPVNNAVLEMMNNKDFYGVEIRNMDDPAMMQLGDESKFVASQFVPFGFRNLGRDTRTSAGSKVEPFIGITPAPYDINMTKAEKEAYEFEKGKIPVGSRTKEQAQHSKDKAKLRSDYMASGDRSAIDAAVSDKTITRKEGRQMIKEAAMTNLQRMTQHLSAEEVEHIMKVASPKEKEELQKILTKKRANKEKSGMWTNAEEELYAKSIKSEE